MTTAENIEVFYGAKTREEQDRAIRDYHQAVEDALGIARKAQP